MPTAGKDAEEPRSAPRGRQRRRRSRATTVAVPWFSFARGVHLHGTNIACDWLGAAGELAFISHGQALGRFGARLPQKRFGRQEVLATDTTLALLGKVGARLRKNALPAIFGRAFALGEARVELLSAGSLPGAASLLVESGGPRLLYAGTVRCGRPAFGAQPGELQMADAVCVEGTFGRPIFTLPDPDEALAAVSSFVDGCAAAGAAAVLLTPPFGTAMDVAVRLAGAGVTLRGHRVIVAAAAAHRQAGVAGVPPIARFAGKLGRGEALLWPPEGRSAPLLGRLERARFAFVSGFSLDPAALAQMRADVAIGLSNQAGYRDLLGYIAACGASEVAVHRGYAEELAADLRQRGLRAYALGPPRQLDLFRG
jgi:hypothetical protein